VHVSSTLAPAIATLVARGLEICRD